VSVQAFVERPGGALGVGRPVQEQRAGCGVGEEHQAFDFVGCDDCCRDVGGGQVEVGQVGVADGEWFKGDDQCPAWTVGRNAGECRMALVDLG
jgi:hypothetical protein